MRAQVKRYYFHQPNKRVMDRFVASRGAVAPERVAMQRGPLRQHVRRRDADPAGRGPGSEGGCRLGSGDLVLVAAVGANVHYGAQLVRL